MIPGGSLRGQYNLYLSRTSNTLLSLLGLLVDSGQKFLL